MVLEKTLESLLDCKEIQPVHSKGNQFQIFIGKADAEAETPIFGHLMQRTDSLEKTLMLGQIEGGRRQGQQEKRWLNGITDSMNTCLIVPGVGDEWGSLVCCSPQRHKESDMTE